MRNENGFDLWAQDYDKSVGLSDEANSYPFAGYKKVLGEIFNRILAGTGRNVLDLGFGTGTLTAKLYENGCTIWGQDFSRRMIEIAQEKMPDAHLYQGDFSGGLVEKLQTQKYDCIVATYTLHHLTDPEKIDFLNTLLTRLRPDGRIYIGDVAFETRNDLEACRAKNGDTWDDKEAYFVYEEIKQRFTNITFTKFSDCAGVFELWA